MKTPSLAKLLKQGIPERAKDKKKILHETEKLQLKMLRAQAGLWHRKMRAIVVFEGFDAAGKGGAIRRLSEKLDPRSLQVYSIAAPDPSDQARHYLYRFWKRLPRPGSIAIFDRSWYGRVLVERVEELTPKERWKQAYREITEFETTLQDDGVELIKIFLAIDKTEQLRRFEQRISDPYKQWKLSQEDVEARRKWDDYVIAVDEMFKKTHSARSPWHLIPANDKHQARHDVLAAVTKQLGAHETWIASLAEKRKLTSLKTALRELGLSEASLK
jgi:polyphosphate kinase 2 (PPK2 family)